MNYFERHLLILTWAIIFIIFFPINVMVVQGIIIVGEFISSIFIFGFGFLILSFFPILYFDYKRNKRIKKEPREERKNAQKTCPNCGNQLPEGNLFCIQCGINLESSNQEEIIIERYDNTSEVGDDSQKTKKFQEEVTFWKSNLNNPFGKVFSYYFIPFILIVGVLGIIFNFYPTIVGIMVAIFFPFIAGFFTLFMLYPLIFQKLKSKKFSKNLYSALIPIIGLVLCIPIWILGIINMYFGFFVFVYFIVVGNMKSIFNKERYNRGPSHKGLNLVIIFIAFILPIVVFGVYLIQDVGVNNLFNSIVIKGIFSHAGVLLAGYLAVLVLCPISLLIVLFSDKELGKRVALFCILYVWVIITWTLKIIGEFTASVSTITQAPVLLITLYNIFKQTRKFTQKNVEKFENTVKVGREGLTYKIFNRFIDEDILDALTFIFFCSAFFGYLTATTGLTSLSISLEKLLIVLNIKGVHIPDFGVVVPYFVQIVIALTIVIFFLVYNMYNYRKESRSIKS